MTTHCVLYRRPNPVLGQLVLRWQAREEAERHRPWECVALLAQVGDYMRKEGMLDLGREKRFGWWAVATLIGTSSNNPYVLNVGTKRWVPLQQANPPQVVACFETAVANQLMMRATRFEDAEVVPERMLMDGTLAPILLDELQYRRAREAYRREHAGQFLGGPRLHNQDEDVRFDGASATFDKVSPAARAAVVVKAPLKGIPGRCSRCRKPTSQRFCWACLHDGGPVAK